MHNPAMVAEMATNRGSRRVIARARTVGGIFRQVFAVYRKQIDRSPLEFWQGVRIGQEAK